MSRGGDRGEVDSESLTKAQVEKLAAVNDRYLQWISAVQRRLNQRGFPMDDELRRVVAKARRVLRAPDLPALPGVHGEGIAEHEAAAADGE